MDNRILEEKKRIIYEFICDARYVPMKQKELAIVLQVPRERREELTWALEELLAEGKIALSKRGRYSKAEEKTVTGIFTSHAKGFGFVSVEDQEEDIFIGEQDTHDAFLGDTVQVAIKGHSGGGRSCEGVITKILAHSVTQVVGTFEKSKSYGFVIPDNQRITKDIFIPLEHTRGAVTGHKVVVELTDYGAGRKSPEGKVIEILGHSNDPGTDILSIVCQGSGRCGFPSAGRRELYLKRAHCGCDQLCAGEQRFRSGSLSAGNQCVPGRSGDSHAAPQPFQRHLLLECRGGPAGIELYHDHRSKGENYRSHHSGDGDSGGQAHDVSKREAGSGG